MTGVGIAFVTVGLLLSVGLMLALRAPVCVALFFYHLVAALFNWQNSLDNPSDSTLYFEQSADFSDFEPGTRAVGWLVASLRDLLGASYFDLYMIFHLFGYLGVVMFYWLCRRALFDVEQLEGRPSPLLYLICFLPGFHVWSSVMGKDELVFFGIMCFLLGLLEPSRRIAALAVGLLICGLVRPHVAALLAVACATAAILSSDVPALWRAVLSGGLGFGLFRALPYLMQFVGLESLDSRGATNLVERWQDRNMEGGSSVDIAHYPFPLKVFTYLYRPLFFDANGLLGVIVSIENLLILGITLLYAPGLLRALRGQQDRFFLRFNLLFWALTTAILCSTTTNLGLAIRQKIMVLPSLLILLLASRATRAVRQAETSDEAAEATESTQATEAPEREAPA